MRTFKRLEENLVGRKPAHADEGSRATTAHSPVAVRGAIGLRSSFSFVSFLLEQQKKRKHTMSENHNKKQQIITIHDNWHLIVRHRCGWGDFSASLRNDGLDGTIENRNGKQQQITTTCPPTGRQVDINPVK